MELFEKIMAAIGVVSCALFIVGAAVITIRHVRFRKERQTIRQIPGSRPYRADSGQPAARRIAS
ncbi:MAG: hypothetical protein ABSF66_04195 [Terriglobales bacterium]|jgi:hypothetical protein